MEDYYSVLGITSNATPVEIKKAYRHMALQFHPDIYKGLDAHERFLQIGEAYGILSDVNKRTTYDRQFKEYQKKGNVPIDHEFENWKKEGRAKAQAHSNMTFNDFKSQILDDLIMVYDKTMSLVKKIIIWTVALYLLYIILQAL